MTDLSKSYEDFNIILQQFKKSIDETERSVLTAVGKINQTIGVSSSLAISMKYPSSVVSLGSDQNGIMTFLMSISGDTTSISGHVTNIAQKMGASSSGEQKSTGVTGKSEWHEGITSLTQSFDNFKDAISALADRFLTVGGMSKIADDTAHLQNFANMTNSSMKDIYQAINVGNRYSMSQPQSLMLYKDMADTNLALENNDPSQIPHRDALDKLNGFNKDVLKKGLTPEQRTEAIQDAFKVMNGGKEENLQKNPEVLALAKVIGRGRPDVVSRLLDTKTHYQEVKKEEEIHSEIQDGNVKTNLGISDKNARRDNSNAANDTEATAKASRYLQWWADFQRKIIENYGDSVAEFKATIAIVDDVNDKLSIFGQILAAIISIWGMGAAAFKIGRGLSKGTNIEPPTGPGSPTQEPIPQESEQQIEKQLGKETGSTLEKEAIKKPWWKKAWRYSKNFGKKLTDISIKRFPQKVVASEALAEAWPIMLGVDAGLLAKDVYDTYQETPGDQDEENKQRDQQKKNKEAKQKAKEDFQKKLEQSKKALDSKPQINLQDGEPIAVPSSAGQKGVPCAMANPYNMAMAKQVQSLTCNTNNNQKFNTVINVSSMATDHRMVAQEFKQTLNNQTLARAYAFASSDSTQQAKLS